MLPTLPTLPPLLPPPLPPLLPPLLPLLLPLLPPLRFLLTPSRCARCAHRPLHRHDAFAQVPHR